MAPQEADQGLGDHPDLCFGSKMEVQLCHSHHHLTGHNTGKIKSARVEYSPNFECVIQLFSLVAKNAIIYLQRTFILMSSRGIQSYRA